MCCEVNIPVLELILFVRMRWGSMFTCLEWALKLQTVSTYTEWQDLVLIHTQAVTQFTQLTDDSDDVPPLRKKTYKGFSLSKHE